MKRISIYVVALMLMLFCVPSYAEELPGADVAAQGYDFYDKAVQYNDIRESLG